MTPNQLAAGVVAAVLSAGATAASAADLDYGRVPNDRYSSAYEDPRYRDLYAPDAQQYSRTYKVQPYAGVPVPPANVYPPHPRDYRSPYDAPRQYSHVDPREGRYTQDRYAQDRQAQGCLHREEIKRRLIDEGWREFQDVEIRQNAVAVRARRPNGDLYDLKVDRCTGDVVNAQVIERRGYGPYAEDGRRYNQRPYN